MKKLLIGLVLCLTLVFGGVFTACASTESQAVNDVTVMIDEIGEVSDVTLNSQAAIDAARAAYDALSEEDKAEVSNYADLQAAEAELATLKEIDALTLTITSAASMKSGAEYTPALSGYEYNDVQTTIAWSVADVGTTGASIENGIVTASGIGRFTLVATVSYAGHNIENQAAITVEVGGYTVSGTIVFPEGNENLASRVTVSSTSGIVGQVTVGENGIGAFTVGVPQGNTTLIFSAPAFEDVTLELENVQADNAHVGEAEFSAYRYTNGAIWAPAEGRVTQKDGDVTVGALDDGNAYATLAFADVRSTQVYLQATISNIFAAHDLNAFDVGFAPILLSEDSYAYELRQNYTGSGVYEEGIARLQGNASNPWVSWMNGTGSIVFQDTNGAWLNQDIPENEEGKIEGVTVTLTLIRDGNKVYVWTQLAGEDTIYHGVDVLDEKYVDYEAGFGLFTRAGTGATFSDISFSTDAEFIAEKLQGSVTLTAETGADNANGTVVLRDADGETIESGTALALGSEVTVVVTPTANTQTDIYYISAATLNDENILDRLKAQQDGSYTYTFTVRGDVSVQVTIAKEVLKTVTGKITLPVGYEYLLTEGTVSAEGVAPTAISADSTYSLNVPAGTQKIIVTLPGFSKEALLNTAQVQGETLNVELTTADYAFEWGYFTSGGTYTAEDGTVKINAKVGKDLHTAVTFADLSASSFLLRATISDIYEGDKENAFDVGFTLAFDGYNVSYELRQSGVLSRMHHGGNVWKLDPVSDRNWTSETFDADDSGLFEGLSIELILVRDGSTVHFWANGSYLGSDDASSIFGADTLCGFGFYTRASVGATFSDISFSTDPAVIAEQLQGSVTLNAQTGSDNANGTVVLRDADGETIESGTALALGSEVTVVVTPKPNTATEVYSITNFTVGGVNVPLESLTSQDGSYTYTFMVNGDTVVNVTISVSQSVKVTGTVTVPAGNSNLLAEGTVMAGSISAEINEEGNFSIIVPEDTTELTVTVPGFSKKIAIDLPDGNAYVIEDPISLTKADYAFEWGYFTSNGEYTVENGDVIIAPSEADIHTALVFQDLLADSYMISATISNIYEGHYNGKTFNSFDVGFTAYYNNANLSYLAQQNGGIYRLYHSGSAWNSATPIAAGAWTDETFTANDQGLFEGESLTFQLVRVGTVFYIWINGTYLGSEDAKDCITANQLVQIGVYARAGTGATFSNIVFSTDTDVIAEQLQGSVALDAQTENNANGTVSLQDAQGETIESGATLALGSEVTVVVTPTANTETEVYSITNFTVGGVNVPLESLTPQDGSYTYTFTVNGDMQVNVTISVAQSVKVTGTVMVPEGNSNLLAEGTVAAGSVSANIGADGTFEIIVPENMTELTVTVPGFTAKKVALVLTDGENEHAIEQTIVLTAADYAFEQGGASNRQEWENVNGSIVVDKTTSDIISVVTLEDVESNAFFLTMTVSNIYVGRNANTFDVGFSIWNGSKVLSYEVRESGNIARFSDAFGWNNGGWIGSSVPGLSNLGDGFGTPDENGLYVGVSITMTMVYQNGQVYLWVGETYLGVAGIPDGYLSANDVPVQFGAFTRAGTGATFSDISFSTDSSVVAEYLAQNVPVEN